jgi:hypothetical protein
MTDDYAYSIAQCDVPTERHAALQSYRDKRRLWLSWIDTDEHHAIWRVLSSYRLWDQLSDERNRYLEDVDMELIGRAKSGPSETPRGTYVSRLMSAAAAGDQQTVVR